VRLECYNKFCKIFPDKFFLVLMRFAWKKSALLSRKFIRNWKLWRCRNLYRNQPAGFFFLNFLMIDACPCLQRSWRKKRFCNNLQHFDEKINFTWNYALQCTLFVKYITCRSSFLLVVYMCQLDSLAAYLSSCLFPTGMSGVTFFRLRICSCFWLKYSCSCSDSDKF